MFPLHTSHPETASRIQTWFPGGGRCTMVDFLNQLNGYLHVPALSSDMAATIAVIGTVIMAIIYCFFGFKAIRVLAAIEGVLLGAALGRFIAERFNLQQPIDLVAVIAGAVVCALLAALLYRLGIFLIVLSFVWLIAETVITRYTTLDQVYASIIALACGVLLGILAAIYARPVVIVVSALTGGFMFSNLIFQYLVHIRWSSWVEMVVRIGVGAVLGIIGIIYQFATTRD